MGYYKEIEEVCHMHEIEKKKVKIGCASIAEGLDPLCVFLVVAPNAFASLELSVVLLKGRAASDVMRGKKPQAPDLPSV